MLGLGDSPFPVPKGLAQRQPPLEHCMGQSGRDGHLAWQGSGLTGGAGSLDKALARPRRAALACPVRCNPRALPRCASPSCLQQQPARFPELLLLEWTLESPDFAELLEVVSEDMARNVFQCMPAKADSEVYG